MPFPNVLPAYQVFTDEDIEKLFNSETPIFFDTNVFRTLWRLDTNPRRSILRALEQHRERLFLPYQTQVELYRQAHSTAVMQSIPHPGIQEEIGRLRSIQKNVTTEVAKVRPQGINTDVTAEAVTNLQEEVEREFERSAKWLDTVHDRLLQWLGTPINTRDVLRGAVRNPLLEEIAELFPSDHILNSPLQDVREDQVAEYKERVRRDEPLGPGRTDENKRTSEDAAGDYLMWREILTTCKERSYQHGFFFVTEEKKADTWEFQQSETTLRRITPEIQAETIEFTGGPMIVIDFQTLIELISPNPETTAILDGILQDAASSSATWTADAYSALLSMLESGGYSRQRKVIEAAAKEEQGFITRENIGRVLGWGGENHHLTRFRVPVDRMRDTLIEQGDLPDSAGAALEAVYDGPGEAIGYAVPVEFVDFQSRSETDSSAS